MFGRSKPVLFEPYGRRRSSWRLPGWLVLLLFGIAAGAAAVLFVQQRYLPPRLSASESAALRTAFDQADGERQRLHNELQLATQALERAQADQKRLRADLASSQPDLERLRDELATVVSLLPPDPRGGTVEVRAAQFSAQGGDLVYDVVLTSDRPGKPITGVMQLVVAGDATRGGDSTVTLQPVKLSIDGHEVLRGRLPLPQGFRPRQTTVQVLSGEAGKQLGMRVLFVK